MTRIVLIASLFLVASFSSRAQDLVDLTGVPEYKVIWSAEIGPPPEGTNFNGNSAVLYTPNLCGIEGMNILTMDSDTRGIVSFSASPMLDTHSVWHWPEWIYSLSLLAPIDYDGVPPLEYVSSRGVFWRCSQGQSPFPLIPIDTVRCGDHYGGSHLADFDLDGYTDAVFLESGFLQARAELYVLRGGPTYGWNCDSSIRVAIPNGHRFGTSIAFYREFDGNWYVFANEYDEDLSGFDGKLRRFPVALVCYKIAIANDGNGWRAGVTRIDSIVGEGYAGGDIVYPGFTDVRPIADTVEQRHHLFLDANSQYHIEDGKLTKGPIFHAGYWIQASIGTALGTIRTVVAAKLGARYTKDRRSRQVFIHIDKPEKPLAILADLHTLGTQNDIRYTVINDLTGDGLPEVFYANVHVNGMLSVYVASLDSNATTIDAESTQRPLLVSMIAEELHVSVYEAQAASIDIVNLSGQSYSLLPNVFLQSGMNVIDLSTHLRAFPHGFYNIVVRVGSTVKYVSILH